MKRPEAREGELLAALWTCRGGFGGVAAMSGVVNLLQLTGAFFMLEVYDRVLPSHSIATLAGLVILAGGLYLVQGMLDIIRNRVLARIGRALDEKVSSRLYGAVLDLPLVRGRTGDGLQPLRDLDQVRGFLSGGGPGALFDLPWLPLYVGICFLFHPWLGLAALFGAVILIIVTILTEVLSRRFAGRAAAFAAERNTLTEAARRNAEVLRAMGMEDRLYARWREANEGWLESQQRLSDISGGFGGAAKALRLMIQSGVLAVGAYLVVQGQASPGIIIAGSILSARALAPVDVAIANWRGFVGARQGWHRLSALLAMIPPPRIRTSLPAPKAILSVEQLAVVPPGGRTLAVQDANFQLRAGAGLGIIGPSAAGKSSLAQALVGVWRPARGTIRLDGGALEQWSAATLGQHIGYLPQDVELFAGSIAENIARFEEKPDAKSLLDAARHAGVHDLVLQLPDGYDTRIGEAGQGLSSGQKQRIGLARALYGDPFLVVLDEPNSNLDAEGEEALTKAILSVRARGGVAVVVAHRPTALAAVDTILVMAHGRQQAFGPKDELLRHFIGNVNPMPSPLAARNPFAPRAGDATAFPEPGRRAG